MNKRDIAALVCRIYGLLMILRAVASAVMTIASALAVSPGSNLSRYVTTGIIGIGLTAAFGFVLWFFADPLAKFIVGDVADSALKMELSAQQVQTIAYSVIGMFMVAHAVPEFIQPLAQYSMERGFSNSAGSFFAAGLIAPVVKGAIGIWLLLGSRGLARAINSLRP